MARIGAGAFAAGAGCGTIGAPEQERRRMRHRLALLGLLLAGTAAAQETRSYCDGQVMVRLLAIEAAPQGGHFYLGQVGTGTLRSSAPVRVTLSVADPRWGRDIAGSTVLATPGAPPARQPLLHLRGAAMPPPINAVFNMLQVRCG